MFLEVHFTLQRFWEPKPYWNSHYQKSCSKFWQKRNNFLFYAHNWIPIPDPERYGRVLSESEFIQRNISPIISYFVLCNKIHVFSFRIWNNGLRLKHSLKLKFGPYIEEVQNKKSDANFFVKKYFILLTPDLGSSDRELSKNTYFCVSYSALQKVIPVQTL